MTRWYSEKKKEHYYKQAKKNGFRARSAYKLKQIQNKYSIIKKGDTILDLGAAPGGWSQVAKALVGTNGLVVGADILPIRSITGIFFIKGDVTEDSTIEKIKEKISESKVDVILSDMSPDISGNYSVDQARSVYLCQTALSVAEKLLKSNGNFVCKLFEGKDSKEFVDLVKNRFRVVKKFTPKASRKSSSEIYIVGISFK